MEEKKYIKIRFGTIICILIILLLLVIIGCMWYNNYTHNHEHSNTLANTNNEQIISNNSIDTIELSNTDKISINKKLYESFNLSLREIINFEQEKNLSYNVNLLDSMKNKYYIVWHTIESQLSEEVNNGLYDNGVATKIRNSIFIEYYEKIFNESLNEAELLNADIPYKPTIKEDMLYTGIATGWGFDPFLLKANKLEYNKNNNTYTLYVDFLSLLKNGEISVDNYSAYVEPSVLEWNNSLNYATLKIDYQKDNTGNYILNSLLFVK